MGCEVDDLLAIHYAPRPTPNALPTLPLCAHHQHSSNAAGFVRPGRVASTQHNGAWFHDVNKL